MLLAVEEEPTVDQPGSPRTSPDGAVLTGPDHPAVANVVLPRLEPEPSMIVVTAGGDLENFNSSPREPDSLALVVAEEAAARRSIAPRALTASFGEKHQRRLYEAIELSGSSTPCELPEAVGSLATREDAPGPILVSDNESPDEIPREEGGTILGLMEEPVNGASTDEDSANEVDDIFVRLSSCAEMEEMLRKIPCGIDADLPPSQLFESVEMVTKFIPCVSKACQ